MIAYLQATRWVNLLYIFATLFLLRFCVVMPLFNLFGFEPTLNHIEYLLLAISTMSIAAGGYLINDYYDGKADAINKPDKLVVGYKITHPQTIRLYLGLTIVGVVLGFILGLECGAYQLGYVHVFTAAALWFYSTTLKRKVLIGNLTIAFIIGLTVLLVLLFDNALREVFGVWLKSLFSIFLVKMGIEVMPIDYSHVANLEMLTMVIDQVTGYAAFAFLLTLVREIVKDAEDVEGDEAAGYNTMAVSAGVGIAKLIATAVTLLVIKLIFDFQMFHFFVGNKVVAILALFFMQLPLLYLVFRLWKARFKADFSHASLVVKVLMLVGLLYLPYFWSTIKVEEGITIDLPPGVSLDDVQFINFGDEEAIDTTATPNDTLLENYDDSWVDTLELKENLGDSIKIE